MKKKLANFGNEILSKSELRNLKGGWCYSAYCQCSDGFLFHVPPGDLNNFRSVVASSCSSGPVNCGNTFTPCNIA